MYLDELTFSLPAAKAMQWRTDPVRALVYVGCFEQGMGGGFSLKEWNDLFEDMFHAQVIPIFSTKDQERLLVGNFERRTIREAEETLHAATGRPIVIEAGVREFVQACDKERRLAAARLICTDVVKLGAPFVCALGCLVSHSLIQPLLFRC